MAASTPGEAASAGPCMSRAEVEDLRDQLSALRIRVYSQEERIEELERQVSGQERDDARTVTSGYSLVSRGLSAVGLRRTEAERTEAEREERTEAARSSAASRLEDETGPVSTGDHEGRARLARQCGRFLRRALQGDFRGSSGRDRLGLGSRYYLICADYEGREQHPPLLLERFAEVRSRCKRASSCGGSVFLGCATKWELTLAIEEGGFERPVGL